MAEVLCLGSPPNEQHARSCRMARKLRGRGGDMGQALDAWAICGPRIAEKAHVSAKDVVDR